jgi:hypothetical protein
MRMADAQEYPPYSKEITHEERFSEAGGAHVIFCPGESPNTVENYVLVSMDGTGFIVIRQTIPINSEVGR